MQGIVIPYSTADSITVANLRSTRELLSELIAQHEGAGSYLHPDDYTRYKKLVKSINKIVKYFGDEE